jgi:hypothetical protein
MKNKPRTKSDASLRGRIAIPFVPIKQLQTPKLSPKNSSPKSVITMLREDSNENTYTQSEIGVSGSISPKPSGSVSPKPSGSISPKSISKKVEVPRLQTNLNLEITSKFDQMAQSPSIDWAQWKRKD